MPEIIEEYMQRQEYKHTTSLCKIMHGFGSDKAMGRHNYTTLYAKLLDQWQDQKIAIFELGVGSNFSDVPYNMGPNGMPGASLRGWASYFLQANIYGADIDRRILFQTNNIRTFYCNQKNGQEIQDMFSNEELKDVEFEFILDDGFHNFDANLTFLLNSMHKLKKGGIYIVEDLFYSAKPFWEAKLSDLQKQFALAYIKILVIPHPWNSEDNTLLIIQK
jgi:hypothetical protein